jgi:hypothetical protein
MKKTIVIVAVAVVTLTATLAFTSKSEVATVKQEKASDNNSGEGFALQDNDQWK